MKQIRIKTVVAVCLGIWLLFSVASSVFSDEIDDKLDQKKQEIDQLKQELSRVQGEKQTLSSTLSYLDGRIKLTSAEIEQTEVQIKKLNEDIAELSGKISELDTSLEEVTQLLLHRVRQAYKRRSFNQLLTLITSGDLNDLVSKYKYLVSAQKNDRTIMYQMEATRVDFNNQKFLKEQKQQELDAKNETLERQKATLDQQQIEKSRLLTLTKNDEIKFQKELSQKLAELEAIQSIIAGNGDETEVGSVSGGDLIAKVIPGLSACSSGSHLHLEVAVNGSHRNPADYLSNKSVVWDNSPDGAFSFNGSWRWPLEDPIRLTQGYGMTFYAATLRYYGGAPHTGIDMVNNGNFEVKAVDNGTLYRGAIPCGGGTLRYVRVKHNDGLSSYYLHVNY